jgi:hypothetical protein
MSFVQNENARMPCGYATDAQNLCVVRVALLSEPLENHWQYFFPSLSIVDGFGTLKKSFVESEHGSVLSEY